MAAQLSDELWGKVLRAVEFRFARSSGPGGQNVNKVETKVEVRVDIEMLPISRNAQAELLAIASQRGWRIGDGTVVQIVDQTTRSRERNRDAALKKLYILIAKALVPKKKRKKSGVPRSQRERRLEGKKVRKVIKERRRKPGLYD